MSAKRKEVGFAPDVVASFETQFQNRITVSTSQVAKVRSSRRRRGANDNGPLPFQPFALPQFPPAATPAPADTLAQDSAVSATVGWSTAMMGQTAFNVAFAEGMTFLGYTYLALLAQRPEYRVMSETIATEMTRKWITFQSKATEEKKKKDTDKAKEKAKEPEGAEDRSPESIEAEAALESGKKKKAKGGADDKADKIKSIEDYFEQLDVRGNFHKMAEYDGFMGRAHLFLDFGDEKNSDADNDKELITAVGDGGDKVSTAKCSPEKPLRRLQPVEALWCYPIGYNSDNPLRKDWYRPQTWYAMGKQVHVSRLLPFVGREVPDQLKPSYAFGGLSLSQMAQPYVDNWLRTRQSVADIVHAFSVMVLLTDLGALLAVDSDQILNRADLFNTTRDNKGLMMVDKNKEDFKNVSAPLSTLDTLQAQTQEHMSSVSRIPLIKLLGIQPAGLNASSEGEIRTFYDTINAYQEKFYRPHLTTIFKFVQLSLFGEVDPDLTFVFEPLWSLDAKGEAEVRKIDAETGQILINSGALDPAEERARVATNPSTPYKSLDVEDMPEPPVDEFDEGDGETAGGGKKKAPSKDKKRAPA